MKYLGADTDQEILHPAVTSPRSLLMKWFLLLSVFLPSACDKPRNVSISLTEGHKDRLQEGDSVTLQCDVLYSQPAITGYSWYQDGAWLPSARRQTMEIRDISYSQFGEYFCEVRNRIGSGRSEGIELRGQYKPRDFQIAHSVNGDAWRDLTSVNERDTVNISCTSQNSDPAVSGYSWYRLTQNKPVSGQILLFESISKDDSGNYQCEARNNVGTGRSHTINIKVQYAPTSVRITFPPSVRAGVWTSLSCQSDGHPAAVSYRWWKECPHGSMSLCSGRQWRSQCSFYASVEDVDCEITCTVRNTVGEKKSDPIRLDIQYGPRNVEIISEDTVKEGTEITLTCRGEANPPVHTYSWRKMCNRQRNNLRENTDTIRIQPTRIDASCSYICRARNSVSSRDSTPKHINVQYGPGDVTIVRSEPQGEVKEGDRVTLTCNSRSNPGARYTWYKDNVNTAVNKGTGNILTIRSITPTESGDYYCKAENVIGSQTSKSFRIEVLYAPRNVMVSVSPSDSAIHEGDNITLSCTSDSNPPTSWYKWERRQREETESLESSERDLTLYRITHKQEGVYSCEAGNTVGANRSEGRRIEVVNGPGDVTIVRSEPQGEVKEGDRVTLTCNSRSNPGARYTWYKDNVNTAVNKGTGNILTIRSITPTESGDYYCKAENVIGEQTSKSFRIEVLYAPRNMQVSVSPSDSTIHEGDNITLSCTSDSNPPTSWYKWELRQGEETEPLESSERDLTLYRITHKQEGVYSCEAGNTVGANRSDGRRITFGNSRGESLHVILILGIRAGIFIVAVVLTVAGVCVCEGQTVKGS
ncbi:B-cell receptor CD22-like [Chiloscyllium punctatum]|uniref:B-cell receptor CD22-like n=1 Tax=Chiloscyllium punctatum TaxID=137246 RepID=UPI003B633FD1